MILDLLVAILLVLAVVKGYQRGLIVGIFSFISIIVGLAAAMKLSIVVAGYIGKAVKVSDEWLPFISFIVVFIIVVLLVRLGANFIQRTAEVAMLGWLNRLGGIVFYVVIYITVFSIVLFYLVQLNMIKQETLDKSITYSYVGPWGPKAINGLASLLPFFKGMFRELEQFFAGVSDKMSHLIR